MKATIPFIIFILFHCAVYGGIGNLSLSPDAATSKEQPMIRAILNREPSTDEGTAGTLTIESLDSRLELKTLELPWRDNKPNHSSIPTGSYVCHRVKSPKWGYVFEVYDVDGRGGILFHIGNWAGNGDRNFRTDTQGCILLGMAVSKLADQKALVNSRMAFDAFMGFMGENSFQLEIIELNEGDIR
jgi:hypothetical protein